MQLPNNEIGISDILEWRRCAARFAHGMRRHVELPPELQLSEGELDDPTEATNENNAYGSAFHECASIVEKESVSHAEAIKRVWPRYARHLDPSDLKLLKDDLDIYERRRPLGVTLVAAEVDMRVPLFTTDDGVPIYFRFKLDVLHRMIANPSVFLHRDYKSSKWQRSPAEVHKDPQQWAYNWAIHEAFPDCQRLIQVYDQLRFGEVTTSKNDAQRAEMRDWLIANVKAILADDQLKPTANEFCRFCPLVVTCRETKRLTREWRGRLALLAPLSKEGRKVKVEFAEDAVDMEDMLRDELPKMIEARKHLEHAEKALKALLVQMPTEEREALGWRAQGRKTRVIVPEGLHELHDLLGEEFYRLVSLPITALEEYVDAPASPELEVARRWTVEGSTAPYVVPAKGFAAAKSGKR